METDLVAEGVNPESVYRCAVLIRLRKALKPCPQCNMGAKNHAVLMPDGAHC